MHLQLERWITKHWQTEQRYYTAKVTQDLFGTWLVERRWGSRLSSRGNSRTRPALSYTDALKQLEQVSKKRTQRGYRAV